MIDLCTKYLTFIFIFFCFSLNSQPKLEKVNYLPELPKLSIDQLTKLTELLTFHHRDGIIVYNDKEDQWKLFKYLEQYEEKGKIINIRRLDSLTVVSLEKGTIILSKDQVVAVASTMLSTFSSGKMLIALSSEIDTTTWDQDYQYNTASQILLFNSITSEIETNKLNKSFYRIESSAFHNNKIWVSVIDDSGPDYWHRSLLEIDLSGNVKEVGLTENFYRVQKVMTYDDNLYVIGDSGLYILNDHDSLIHIADIGNCDQYDIINKSNFIYFVMNNHRDHGAREIEYLKFDLNDFTSERVSFICDANSLNYSEYIIHKNALLCNNDIMSRVDKIDIKTPHSVFKYSIRDGITSSINYMVEDQSELWFLTMYNGLSRFSKVDSTWKNYMINTDLRIDSTQFLFYSQITINEDYLFILLQNNDSRIRNYLIFNRLSETFEFLTRDEFRKRFFFFEDKFANYKGEQFVSNEYSDTLSSIINYIDEWLALLFLYDLAVSGSDKQDYGNKIINKPSYNIISYAALDPPEIWYLGVIIKYKDNKTIEIFSYPRPIRNFDCSIVPYIIAGDDEKIYVSGNSCKGIFTYTFFNEKLQSYKQMYDSITKVRFIKESKDHVIIGTYRYKLFALEKTHKNIFVLNNLISGSPLCFETTLNYNYVGTAKELIYLDDNMSFLGKLFKGQSNLLKTNYSLYLNARNNIFRVVEN